jgi:hypothetical protein
LRVEYTADTEWAVLFVKEITETKIRVGVRTNFSAELMRLVCNGLMSVLAVESHPGAEMDYGILKNALNSGKLHLPVKKL